MTDRRVGGNEMHRESANYTGKSVGFGTRSVFTFGHLHAFGKVISNIILNFFSKVKKVLSILLGCYEDSISANTRCLVTNNY